MFALRRPDEAVVKGFLARGKDSALTYQPVGLSQGSSPGYNHDELRVKIGQGADQLARAQRAIDSWRPLRVPWVQAFPAEPSPEVGSEVVVVARHLGFWSINVCRVVQRFPSSAEDSRYGFVYGTLTDHAESGEESFAVSISADGSVWYEIRAVSRPRAFLARVGYPVSRRLQSRFRRESVRSMIAAVQG